MFPHVGGHDVAQGVEVAGVGEVVQPPVTAGHVLYTVQYSTLQYSTVQAPVHGGTGAGAGGHHAQPTLSMR